jgi:hypothetical protein
MEDLLTTASRERRSRRRLIDRRLLMFDLFDSGFSGLIFLKKDSYRRSGQPHALAAAPRPNHRPNGHDAATRLAMHA